MQNLLPEPPATLLPVDPAEETHRPRAGRDRRPLPDLERGVGHPRRGRFRDGEVVTAYAYARTGYHRGLDQLRRNGWKGHGPVPWSHAAEPWASCAACTCWRKAADAIGEADEAARCAQFLRDCDPAAADALAG